jgi:aminoglycoside phosphotransferase family enzyme/predicted kinase
MEAARMTNWHPEPAAEGGLDPVATATHVSLLVFAGDRAYKLKKAVHTPFLDFSTPELRQQACEREVELNRRFAPDVYLGVAKVLGPEGEVCDSLVVMRRMPPARRLATLAREGRCENCLKQVAEVVAAFHRVSPTGPEIDAECTRDAVLARWEANIAELEGFAVQLDDPSLPERIAGLARAYLAGRRPLFDSRIAGGSIRDGHGDLLADDIYCLDDGPRILDCLEFDDRLRYVDVLDDAGFLAMDLERIAGPGLGEKFLQAYVAASGETHPESLSHHYRAYRAHVRAKVASMRFEQGDRAALAEATGLLKIAFRHLQAGQVTLVLVGGLPGTGKSTVARSLGEERGWNVLRSDEVRKELRVEASTHEPAAFREGLYRPEVTAANYSALIERAQGLLKLGYSVILDASWSSEQWREAAARTARESSAGLIQVRCEAPASIAEQRIAARSRRGEDPSDATAQVARAMAAEFDPWPQAEVLDASGELSSTRIAAGRLVSKKLSTGGRPR